MRKLQDKSIKNDIKINFIISSLVFNDFIIDYYQKLQNIKCKYKDPKISVVFYRIKLQQIKYIDLLISNLRIQMDKDFFILVPDPSNLVDQKK